MSGNASSFAISPSAVLKNPTTFRYTITAPNVEESFSLPTGTKAFIAKNTGARFIKVAYATGEIAGGNYFTLAPWAPHPSPGTISQSSITFYVEAPGLETIEFDIWR